MLGLGSLAAWLPWLVALAAVVSIDWLGLFDFSGRSNLSEAQRDSIRAIRPFIPTMAGGHKTSADRSGSSVSVGVQCPSGQVEGVRLASAVDSFLGIRYAKAERWREAELLPEPGWDGVLQATKEGNVCPQRLRPKLVSNLKKLGKAVRHSEDCLFLNVYRPVVNGSEPPDQDASQEKQPLLPVMVWIHGGSFVTGAGSFYDGSVLAIAGNVIVVTVNYRLGLLGSLKLPSAKDVVDGGPGASSLANFALSDLSKSLHWVKRNIASFGGNPNQVTLFGESAGGALTGWLLLGEQLMPDNMVTGAILQSGTPNALWAWRSAERAEHDTVQFVDAVGCGRESAAEQLSCLHDVSTEDVLTAQAAMFEPVNNRHGTPVIEVHFSSPVVNDVIIKQSPNDLLGSLEHRNISVIIGCTASEMSFFVAIFPELLSKVEGHSLTLDYWAEFVSDRLALLQPFKQPYRSQLSDKSIGALQSLVDNMYGIAAIGRQAQLGSKRNASALLTAAIISLWSHTMFECAALEMSEKLIRRLYTVHHYNFAWTGSGASKEWLGAGHTAEIDYMLGSPLLGGVLSHDNIYNVSSYDDAGEQVLSEQMIQLWTDFSRSGSESEPSFTSIHWPAAGLPGSSELQFTDTGLQLKVPRERERHCRLWHNVIRPLIEELDKSL